MDFFLKKKEKGKKKKKEKKKKKKKESNLLNVIGVTLRNLATELLNTLIQLLLLLLGQPVLVLLKSLLGRVKSALSGVNNLNRLSPLSILLSVGLSLLNEVLNLSLRKTTRGLKTNLLFLSGGVVTSGSVHDTVSVNIEGDLNLGDTLGGRGDTNQLEVSELLVVGDHVTLTLEDNNVDLGLTISGGGVNLRLLGGDGGVTGDQTGEDTTIGLNTKRKGGNIKEEETGVLSTQDTTLDGSSHSDGLIGVDTLVRVLVEDLLDGVDNLGGPGHTSDQDDLINLAGGDLGVLEGLLAGLDGPLDQTVDQIVVLGTGEGHVKMLGSRGIGGDVRKRDGGLHGGGQLALGLLGLLPEPLEGKNVAGKIDTGLLLVLGHDVVLEGLVKVLTSEEGVTVGGLDFEDTVTDLQDGDIEGTTSKIVNSDGLLGGVLLGKTVSEGSSSGLVDDSLNINTGDLTSVLGGLPLGVVEVGGDGDDGLGDGSSQMPLSGLLHGGEDKRSNVRGRVRLATAFNPGITVVSTDDRVRDGSLILLGLLRVKTTTDQPLGGKEGTFRVGGSLTLGGDTNQPLTLLGESNNGRGGTGTLGVLDNTGASGFQSGNTGVSGSQINTNDGTLAIRVGTGLGDEGRTGNRGGLAQDARAEQRTSGQHAVFFLGWKTKKNDDGFCRG